MMPPRVLKIYKSAQNLENLNKDYYIIKKTSTSCFFAAVVCIYNYTREIHSQYDSTLLSVHFTQHFYLQRSWSTVNHRQSEEKRTQKSQRDRANNLKKSP